MPHEDPPHRSLLRRSAPAIVLTSLSLVAVRALDTSVAAPSAVVIDEGGTPAVVDAADPIPSATSTDAKNPTGQRTLTGPQVSTKYGPVQVQATVDTNGDVLLAQAITYPNRDQRSARISDRAVPLLDEAATRAGDASFDGVSGATYTTIGYKASLQAILDAR